MYLHFDESSLLGTLICASHLKLLHGVVSRWDIYIAVHRFIRVNLSMNISSIRVAHCKMAIIRWVKNSNSYTTSCQSKWSVFLWYQWLSIHIPECSSLWTSPLQLALYSTSNFLLILRALLVIHLVVNTIVLLLVTDYFNIDFQYANYLF